MKSKQIYNILIDTGEKLSEETKSVIRDLINDIPSESPETDYESIGLVLALFTAKKEYRLCKSFIDKTLTPDDAKTCFEILEGVINSRRTDDEGTCALEILEYLVDKCNYRVDGFSKYGKDALQTAAQQAHEVDRKIVRIILNAKNAPKLEGELSDFALHLIDSKKIHFRELEEKKFFNDRERMIGFLESYSREHTVLDQSLEKLCEKIKENYGVDYKKDITTDRDTSFSNSKVIHSPTDLEDKEVDAVIKQKPRIGIPMLTLGENRKSQPSTDIDAKYHNTIKQKDNNRDGCCNIS